MVLRILSILGIIVLILLAVLLVAVLLLLLVPVAYRGYGSAHNGKYQMLLRFRWLFGAVRGSFNYDGNGAWKIKALWLTLYDSGGNQRDIGTKEENREEASLKTDADKGEAGQKSSFEERPSGEQIAAEQGQPSGEQTAAEREKPSDRLSGLKEIIQRCLAIALDEDNQALVGHALNRLGRILRSMRPRCLRLEAIVGTGEPDTTGYLYGAFWAVRPFLGSKCYILVTPDFERQILEGEVSLRGRIMAVVLLRHIVRVILDKRLRRLIDQLKNIQNGGKMDAQ
ncbi:MAG: DUF2953 domain-containing protein [Muribaculum sp.]|nr:DUF2953 domain-containing protein [Muribaculum sp.]